MGVKSDVLDAMSRYRQHLEKRGMLPERIEEEFVSLVEQTLSATRKEPKPASARPAKSKRGVIRWGFHGKVPMDINESDSLRKRLGDDEFIRCTRFMDDFVFRNDDTRQWSKDFAAATLRCS